MTEKIVTRSFTAERLADGYVVLSTETPCEQDGLILKADGWDLSRFERIPMKMAYNHDTYSPPIGRWEGTKVVGKKLVGKPVFASAEDPDRAGVIAKLWDGGFLDDTSISFRVDGNALTPVKVKGRDFLESHAHYPIEASIVFAGADPNAGKGRLLEAVSRGVITEEEARSMDPPEREPHGNIEERAVEIEALTTEVANLREGLETARAEIDRLREEIARATTPAAPDPDPEPQPVTPEPETITLDMEAIRTAARKSVAETVGRITANIMAGRLPD